MHGSTIGGGYGTHSYFGLGENSCLFSGKGTSDIAEFRSGNSGTTIQAKIDNVGAYTTLS